MFAVAERKTHHIPGRAPISRLGSNALRFRAVWFSEIVSTPTDSRAMSFSALHFSPMTEKR